MTLCFLMVVFAVVERLSDRHLEDRVVAISAIPDWVLCQQFKMEDRGPTPLDRLVPYEKIGKIEVRIGRIWRPRFSGMTKKYAGLHCVLVDEKMLLVMWLESNIWSP